MKMRVNYGLLSVGVALLFSVCGVLAGDPAPVNPYNGMQDREEKFEFAAKPQVAKGQDRWIITFAATAACDATVTIINKEGKIVRHLASGVLGKNAPYPFQQNSLAQKLEWDGLADDFKKTDSTGCRVKVGLGLHAAFERNMGFDPYDLGRPDGEKERGKATMYTAPGADGQFYVGLTYCGPCVRLFSKEGKYVRTVLPLSSSDMEKHLSKPGAKYAVSESGEKLIIGGWMGIYSADGRPDNVVKSFLDFLPDIKLSPGMLSSNTLVALVPKSEMEGQRGLFQSIIRVAVDNDRGVIYAGREGLSRLDCRTGQSDKTFQMEGHIFDHAMGPDGLLYINAGRGSEIFRINPVDGKVVPFKKEHTFPIPEGYKYRPMPYFRGDIGAVFIGNYDFNTGGCMDMGLHISPYSGGRIVCGNGEFFVKWAKEKGFDKASGPENGKAKETYVHIFDHDGKMLAFDAVGDIGSAQGVVMDRDGNIYVAKTDLLPPGQAWPDGIKDAPKGAGGRIWGGAKGLLVKYRGLGDKYPLNVGAGMKIDKTDLPGALWAYGMGGQTHGRTCMCGYARFAMDASSRLWIPANHVFSVRVLDSNGNRILRIGRYGNVDDADPKHGKIHFAWLRAVAASDSAMYAADAGNSRILKAALSYAVEDAVALP
jgi:hypothetical protein